MKVPNRGTLHLKSVMGLKRDLSQKTGACLLINAIILKARGTRAPAATGVQMPVAQKANEFDLLL